MRMFLNTTVNDTSLDPRPLPSLHMRRRYSSLSWNTRKQVFERDNGHSISYAIFPRKTRVAQMHRTISRQENITDNLIPFPSLASQRVYGLAYADITTKISRMDGSPNFLSYGATLARAKAPGALV